MKHYFFLSPLNDLELLTLLLDQILHIYVHFLFISVCFLIIPQTPTSDYNFLKIIRKLIFIINMP